MSLTSRLSGHGRGAPRPASATTDGGAYAVPPQAAAPPQPGAGRRRVSPALRASAAGPAGSSAWAPRRRSSFRSDGPAALVGLSVIGAALGLLLIVVVATWVSPSDPATDAASPTPLGSLPPVTVTPGQTVPSIPPVLGTNPALAARFPELTPPSVAPVVVTTAPPAVVTTTTTRATPVTASPPAAAVTPTAPTTRPYPTPTQPATTTTSTTAKPSTTTTTVAKTTTTSTTKAPATTTTTRRRR